MTAILPQHKLIPTNLRRLLTSKELKLDSVPCCDIVDNPFSELSTIERDIHKKMKYERNRLYSFQNKWNSHHTRITPESLAGAGLFYLQQEDTVQCPFCFVKISHWTIGDNPLREHMKRRPKCPFLMGCEVGNVPLSRDSRQLNSDSSCAPEENFTNSVSYPYKPKHPRMNDVKRRILTYSGWPVNWLSPQQLAECGLYYSGVADVVTCFFCGGSLGNWEPNDDPWIEHRKFFPDCTFLAIAKSNRNSDSQKEIASCLKEPSETVIKEDPLTEMSSMDVTTDIIQEARGIFPDDLVYDSVQRKGGNILSLQELCDDILEVKQDLKENKETDPQVLENTESEPSSSTSNSQALLCVICMDRERGVAYQPCGHFVSCPKCANVIADCPVCRTPITHRIRIYHT